MSTSTIEQPETEKKPQVSSADEYFTPALYVELARLVMGRIDLDPASCAEANQTVRAIKYFTIAETGLNKGWSGSVFLNPPYSKVAPWIEKLLCHFTGGQVQEAITITNVRTDTGWGQSLLDYKQCFVAGRINFDRPAGETKKDDPRNGTVVTYLGYNTEWFTRVFSLTGKVK